MTVLAPGLRVRVSASANPLVAGKLATVSHQLTVSRRWRITFDEADTFGRHMIGAVDECDLTVVEDEAGEARR